MRKFSFVTVVAATVGVLLVAGAAAAAGHFIITNVHQIKPSVRAELKGDHGPRGFRGAIGVTGAPGAPGLQGPQGVAGAAGSARAVAVVNPDGSLLAGTSFPKSVTGVSHTVDSGIYCVHLSGGIDPSDAVVSAAGAAVGVLTVPPGPDCASGDVEVKTFGLFDSSTPGAPVEVELVDGGFTVLVP
jgi:hypothetical protein